MSNDGSTSTPLTTPDKLARKPQHFASLRAHTWMICNYGIRRCYSYGKARRDGIQIDYAQAFSAHERALLEEHMDTVPWRQDG